jgi:hypothetical protein
MGETSDEMRYRAIVEHLATTLGLARSAYQQQLDTVLQFVVDEATTPTRRGVFSPGAAVMSAPGETTWSRFKADGHLTTWEAGATDPTTHRLNRADLRAAADRLGLLDALPELGSRP